jgi:hypothetical protein
MFLKEKKNVLAILYLLPGMPFSGCGMFSGISSLAKPCQQGGLGSSSPDSDYASVLVPDPWFCGWLD